jgi:hypothetical protein
MFVAANYEMMKEERRKGNDGGGCSMRATAI